MKGVGVDGGRTWLSEEETFEVEIRLPELQGRSCPQCSIEVQVVDTMGLQLGQSVVNAAMSHDRRHAAKGLVDAMVLREAHQASMTTVCRLRMASGHVRICLGHH